LTYLPCHLHFTFASLAVDRQPSSVGHMLASWV